MGDQGYSYSTIASVQGVVKPAFQRAYTEDIIRRNPFEFRLDIVPNNTQRWFIDFKATTTNKNWIGAVLLLIVAVIVFF